MPENNDSRRFADGFRSFFSTKGVFSLRNLTFMGLMLAVSAVLSRYSIFLTPTFKAISFSYLPGALVAALLGPWAALVYGFVNDFVSYIANPQGAYFPGYAISEMLSYFIYACFLFRRPITFLRVFFARALITVTVVLGINFIWMSMMYGTAAGGYYTGARLLNNIVQLPFHAILTTYVGKLIAKMNLYATYS